MLCFRIVYKNIDDVKTRMKSVATQKIVNEVQAIYWFKVDGEYY